MIGTFWQYPQALKVVVILFNLDEGFMPSGIQVSALKQS